MFAGNRATAALSVLLYSGKDSGLFQNNFQPIVLTSLCISVTKVEQALLASFSAQGNETVVSWSCRPGSCEVYRGRLIFFVPDQRFPNQAIQQHHLGILFFFKFRFLKPLNQNLWGWGPRTFFIFPAIISGWFWWSTRFGNQSVLDPSVNDTVLCCIDKKNLPSQKRGGLLSRWVRV